MEIDGAFPAVQRVLCESKCSAAAAGDWDARMRCGVAVAVEAASTDCSSVGAALLVGRWCGLVDADEIDCMWWHPFGWDAAWGGESSAIDVTMRPDDGVVGGWRWWRPSGAPPLLIGWTMCWVEWLGRNETTVLPECVAVGGDRKRGGDLGSRWGNLSWWCCALSHRSPILWHLRFGWTQNKWKVY